MNKEQASGKFNQLKGQIKKTWGKLTDDDIALYEGNAEEFFGKVEEKYGIDKETAEKRLKEMQKGSKAA